VTLGRRSELDLRNPEPSALEIWTIVRNLVLGSGTLVAADFGRTELVDGFHLRPRLQINADRTA
jgi:hypothetical protein